MPKSDRPAAHSYTQVTPKVANGNTRVSVGNNEEDSDDGDDIYDDAMSVRMTLCVTLTLIYDFAVL